MSAFSVNCCVNDGKILIDNLPFPDGAEVKVIIIPKIDLSQMSFNRVRELTKSIKGNLSDDIREERDER
jgi:hypothetical protein